ncbi:unnamed protein product [Lampetra planeri]
MGPRWLLHIDEPSTGTTAWAHAAGRMPPSRRRRQRGPSGTHGQAEGGATARRSVGPGELPAVSCLEIEDQGLHRRLLEVE